MKTLISILFLYTAFNTTAQNWLYIASYGSASNETLNGLSVAKDESVILAGAFQGNLPLSEQVLTSKGDKDIFLIKISANGSVNWTKRAGGAFADDVTAITTDQNDNIICAGNFRLLADFDHLTLSAGQNPNAIFLVKYNADGQLLWGKAINGTGLKDIGDVACDKAGNILVAGFFEDSLAIADTVLQSEGNTDLFVAKFTPAGELTWALRQGQSGDTRGTAVGLTADSDVVIAGYFNDTTRIADTVLTANTYDRDAFLTRISKDGQPLWAKKAGGVFDDDVTALALDSNDHIYLSGYLVGVMRLSDQLSIQSSTGMPDFFVLKYAPDGSPLLARALGGTLTQQAMDLALWEEQPVIVGFYQGDMNFDGFSFSAGSNFNSFIAAFDSNLTCRWAKNIVSNASAFATRIGVENQTIWAGGSFIGQADFDEQSIRASGNSFDVFLAKTALMPTAIFESTPKSSLFLAFPNPAKDVLLIQTSMVNYQIKLFDSVGRLLYSGAGSRSLDLSHLPAGVYWLQFQMENKMEAQKIIKE